MRKQAQKKIEDNAIRKLHYLIALGHPGYGVLHVTCYSDFTQQVVVRALFELSSGSSINFV